MAEVILMPDKAWCSVEADRESELSKKESIIRNAIGREAWLAAVNDNSMSIIPGYGAERHENIGKAA